MDLFDKQTDKLNQNLTTQHTLYACVYRLQWYRQVSVVGERNAYNFDMKPKALNRWRGFDAMETNYVRLDGIKFTA